MWILQFSLCSDRLSDWTKTESLWQSERAVPLKQINFHWRCNMYHIFDDEFTNQNYIFLPKKTSTWILPLKSSEWKNILHRLHINAWYQHKQLSRHVPWSILYIKRGDSLWYRQQIFHTVSMRWIWMNYEMSPLQPWGGINTTKTTWALTFYGRANCENKYCFQDKGTTVSKKPANKNIPLKPHECCG